MQTERRIGRRHFMAGSAALLTTACVTPGVPSAFMSDAPGDHRIGDTTLSVLSDGYFELPSAAFFDAAGEPVPTLPARMRVGANVWLVQTGSRTVLIDAGAGDAIGATVGRLGAVLAARGIGADAIDDVVITHMHPDHIGGLMVGGAKRYPNAALHLSRADWTYWTDPATVATVPQAQRGVAALAAKLAGELAYDPVFHDGEADLGGGISLLSTPGHTPGHCAVRVASGGDQIMLLGDAILSEAAQFADPDIRYILDVDADAAVATRRKLLDMLSADGIAFSATHIDGPSLLRTERVDAEGAEYRMMRTD